jgi:hypothetical protein
MDGTCFDAGGTRFALPLFLQMEQASGIEDLGVKNNFTALLRRHIMFFAFV